MQDVWGNMAKAPTVQSKYKAKYFLYNETLQEKATIVSKPVATF